MTVPFPRCFVRLLSLLAVLSCCCLAPSPVFAASAWTTQMVDSASLPKQFTALALDSAGKMHLSYYQTSGTLRYATNRNGGWTVSTLRGSDVVNAGTGIAVTSADDPQVFYYAYPGSTGARCLTIGGSDVAVGPAYTPGFFVGMAAASRDGFSFLAYSRGNTLYYAVNTSVNDYGTWADTQIDSVSGSGSYSSIALDGNGKAHVVGYNSTSTDLFYYTNAGGSWTKSTMETSANDVGAYCSIAVGRVGGVDTLFVAYLDKTLNKIKFASKPVGSGDWSISASLDAGATTTAPGGYLSLAADNTGAAHISYYYAADFTHGSLRYATNLGGAWSVEEVDASAQIVGRYSAIAVDANQKVSIAYYDFLNSWLKAAIREALLVSEAAVDFGVVDPGSLSAVRTVTVTNNLPTDLTVAGSMVSGADAAQFTVVADSCTGLLLAPQGSCTIQVRFAPASGTPLPRSATLSVTSGAPSAATRTVALSGIATDRLIITAYAGNGGAISPAGSFTVPRGADHTFSITPAPGFSVADLLDNGVSQGSGAGYLLTGIQQDHTLQALFVSPFRIFGFPSVHYASILGAYGAAADGETIQSQGIATGENLLIDRNVSATLKGGYDTVFSSQTGSTTLHRILVSIPNSGPGRLIAEKLVIR